MCFQSLADNVWPSVSKAMETSCNQSNPHSQYKFWHMNFAMHQSIFSLKKKRSLLGHIIWTNDNLVKVQQAVDQTHADAALIEDNTIKLFISY